MEKSSDRRVLKAYAALDSGGVELLSLDLFDTLVWRKVPTPKDLFLLLGKELKEQGWLISAVTAENFAELRIAGEETAREQKKYGQNTTEVTLAEIYWQLQTLFVKLTLDQMLEGGKKGIYESDISEVVKIELALEKKLIRFDANIFQLILYAKQKKIPVVLVSNTYFEEEQIGDLLAPILPQLDALYLSCVFGCDKQSGLFKQMVAELRVAPERILHIGDSYECDILPASEIGIATLYYPKYDAALEEILEREWPEDRCKRLQCLDPHQGDFGISALRAKILHHTALHAIKNEDQFFWKYGATLLGPILLGFVHWIYVRCQQMGVTQLFCLMREGELYAQLINLFAPYYPQHRVETKYLWVSRLFITHASLANASNNALIATMKAFLEHFTMEDFCLYLGLDIGKMHKWSKYRHVMLEDSALRKEFILYLLKHQTLRSEIAQNAAGKRSRFLKYLSGLTDLSKETQMTLVDVGWNGTAQQALHQILALANSPLQLHGLYLGTTHIANAALLAKVITEGYLFKGGDPPHTNAYKKGCFVLEQVATAATGLGPLLDITSDGDIITHPFLIPPKQKRQAQIVQQGIFAFFEFAGEAIKSGALVLDAHSDALQNQLRNLLLRSMLNATQTEALKFGSWQHEHGPTAQLTQVIGKNNYYDRFIKDMLPIAAFEESGLNWPAAYTAKQCKYLTLISEAMWLKTLPPQCFLSQDNFSLRIFLDTGKNFSKKATQHIDLRSNPNRHFYTLVQLFSSKKAMKRILLMLSFSSSLVRIKSLRFVIYDKNTPVPQQLAFFESQTAPPSIECIWGKQIDSNTFYCDDYLKLIHTFDNSAIYQIKLKLCCEMFQVNKKSR
jgi:predicted HAD superfamily hydrolase